MSNLKSVRNKLSRSLEIPEDGLGSASRLQIIGNSAILCGCKRILKYKSEEIVALTKDQSIAFCGEHLKCVYFFEGTLEICGEINAVKMEKK